MILPAEHLELAIVGETFWHIFFDQFTRLRNGDRFYFENQSPTTDPIMSNPKPLSDAEVIYSHSLIILFLFFISKQKKLQIV
jgi:hypothetical protein